MQCELLYVKLSSRIVETSVESYNGYFLYNDLTNLGLLNSDLGLAIYSSNVFNNFLHLTPIIVFVITLYILFQQESIYVAF
jgi:hypothetical protein